MRRTVAYLMLIGAFPLHGQLPPAVEAIPEGRVLEFDLDPDRPAFGETFQLHLTLRLGPELVTFLPDTLIPTETAQSAGTGSWQHRIGPGDSVEVTATYPAVGFVEGLIELPWIELGFLPRGDPASGDTTLVRSLASSDAEVAGRPPTRLLRLGGVDVGTFEPLDAEGLGASPRPPADVIGSGWSVTRVLAVTLLPMAAIAGLVTLGRESWTRITVASAQRGQTVAPRQRALAELERIRSLGWHRNGRLPDFYEATGDALRRYAGSLEPDWGSHLTSSELVARLDERWRSPEADALGATIGRGEGVKFGRHRPDPERAERDWEVIRDWIRERPEG
jgi:hypothetical protein